MTKEMIFILPEQAGQTETSIWKILASNADQDSRYLVEPDFLRSLFESASSSFEVGTTFFRNFEFGARIP